MEVLLVGRGLEDNHARAAAARPRPASSLKREAVQVQVVADVECRARTYVLLKASRWRSVDSKHRAVFVDLAAEVLNLPVILAPSSKEQLS